MLSFEIRKPGGESEVRKVHRDVIHIGASSGNDLVVRARGVLGRHARISVVGEDLRLEILGTTPGADVTLNGSAIKSASLSAGDRISIGEATITLLNGPPPNPNRMAAPPARGRDAFSVASAALSMPPQQPAASPAPAPAPAPQPVQQRFAAEGRPRAADSSADQYPTVRRSDSGTFAPVGPLRIADVWTEVFGRLRRPSPLDERLQEIASYLASSTPIHSIAFLSIFDHSAGEAVAAIWKGTIPRLSRRTLSEAMEKAGPLDVFEAGARIRLYPVYRPAAEAVGLMITPLEVATAPGISDLLVQLAAAVGFVHAERGEAPFGERGTALPPAPAAGMIEDPLSMLIGGSLAVQNLKSSLQRVAAARAPVLLIGEVGSGKSLVAEILHALSPRRPRPLVRVAATASTAVALEEDLLGSGAQGERRKRSGRLFEADGGTLVIEEVGDLPMATQALIYRLLEAREVVATGGRSVPLDIRVIGTSSRPLSRTVEEGAFRDDLYFRLSALTLRLPPLKDRKEDLPALIDAFAQRHGGPMAAQFDVEAMNALLNYSYPGNVRELENEVRRLSTQSEGGPVGLPDLDPKFREERVELALAESEDLKEIVEKVERQVIERVMRKVRGNQSLGARLLNISRGSLIAKLKMYDIKDFRYLKRAGE
jgi:transcriptional regulator with AAA-type ATPase domain